jgi:hypothetical protein
VTSVAARRPATLIGQLTALLAGLFRPRDGRKARAWAGRIAVAVREHVTTAAAFASIDLGCFRASLVAGWIALGVSLLLLEWKIRG